MNKWRVGIIGATGMVGQRFIGLLLYLFYYSYFSLLLQEVKCFASTRF
jgi:aspartate-semialdehyde dehydrogenase